MIFIIFKNYFLFPLLDSIVLFMFYSSESLRNRFNAVPSADSPERRILLVDLYKEADVGIGITIVGGDTVSKLDLGIFVQSVIPGGPADQDGRIKTGDRIIAGDCHSIGRASLAELFKIKLE